MTGLPGNTPRLRARRIVALPCCSPARRSPPSQPSPPMLAPLGADDFDAKSAAIDKLVADARRAARSRCCSALADGSLVATDKGHVLVQTDDGDKDAADRQDRATLPDAQSSHVCNNLLRGEARRRVVGAAARSRPTSRSAAPPSPRCCKNPRSRDAAADRHGARAPKPTPTLKKRLDTLWAHDRRCTIADAANRLEAVHSSPRG